MIKKSSNAPKKFSKIIDIFWQKILELKLNLITSNGTLFFHVQNSVTLPENDNLIS